MNIIIKLFISVFFFILPCMIAAQPAAGYVHQSSTTYQWPTDSGVLKNLDKWQDQKFGVLFHWGIYSSLGLVESWSLSSDDGDRTSRRQDMSYEEFKKWYWGLKDTWNPIGFNPEQWADVMERAGMKYAIFTTKHHDGFCMYDSKFTDYSIVNGAFKNNPRKDVARHVWDAFRKKNFMIGAYFSKPDWHHGSFWWNQYATPNRHVNYSIERYPDRWANFQEFTANQIKELMTDYGHFDILWLDGGWVSAARKQDIKMDEIVADIRRTQTDLLVVDRTIPGPNENYQTPERAIPKEQKENPWESCITLSNDWGWRENDTYKSPEKVISTLVEIVAKGGCLLLGVGPTPEGIIEQSAVNVLQKIGDWLHVNGDAIYNTRITPNYHDGSVWFTANKDGETLYAIYVLEAGKRLPATIQWKGNLPKGKMRLLQNNKEIRYSIQKDVVKIELPRSLKQESLVFSFEGKE